MINRELSSHHDEVPDLGQLNLYKNLPPLGSTAVQVWQAKLDSISLPEKWESVLSPDEHERADRFRFDRDRRRFVACRLILRVLLASYLQVEPAAIRFQYSSRLKPSLGNQHASSDIRFNVSHSGEMALLAFTHRRELGVDVEQIRGDIEVELLAERFFSRAERETLTRIPPEIRHNAFFDCWVRKEAFVKAKGEGLFLPLADFDVSLTPGEPAQLLGTRPDGEERKRWSLCAVDAGTKYAAALVVEGPLPEVVNYDFETLLRTE